MKLIVGLGNPGKQYEKTRHNIGFIVLDALHEKLKDKNISEWSLSKKFNAKIAGGTIDGEKIFLAKPMTFMNDSGQAVQLIAKYYKIPVKDILIVHDDKDLELGKVKMQEDRGHAGHGGVRSILALLKTKSFARVRVGVGNEKKQSKMGTTNFVLGRFGIFEKKSVQAVVEESLKYITEFLK